MVHFSVCGREKTPEWYIVHALQRSIELEAIAIYLILFGRVLSRNVYTTRHSSRHSLRLVASRRSGVSFAETRRRGSQPEICAATTGQGHMHAQRVAACTFIALHGL